MRLNQLNTNKALWLGVSAILFLLQIFFIEENAGEHKKTFAANFWDFIWGEHYDSNTKFVVGVCYLLWLVVCLGIPTLIIGWVIHAIILVIGEYVKSRR